MPTPQNTPEALFEQALARIAPDQLRSEYPPFDGVDFAANDYLGLAQTPFSAEALTGATGSRLLSGVHPQLLALEKALAAHHQSAHALVFPSAYQANLALIQSLVNTGGRVVVDKYIHASVIDALRLAEAPITRFRHNDPEHLAQILAEAPGAPTFVVTEAVYSIHGNRAPVADLLEVCEATGALLVLDEAHSCGWMGSGGRGLALALDVADRIPVRVLGFGKAWGASGGALLIGAAHRQWMLNTSRALIYSTALSPMWCALLLDRLRAVDAAEPQRIQLHKHLTWWGERTGKTPSSPIQFLPCADNSTALHASKALLGLGMRALPIRKPTAPGGQPGLRINLSAAHTREQLEALAAALDVCLPGWNS